MKKCIIVSGMHRSATSALSATFENLEVFNLNEKIQKYLPEVHREKKKI